MRALTKDELDFACQAGGGSTPTVVVVTAHRYQPSASTVSRTDFGTSASSPPPIPAGTRHQTAHNNSYVTKITLSASKLAVLDAIVDYGVAHGYSAAVIATVATDAYKESSLDNSKTSPTGTYKGLFQYGDATWAQNGETGSITSQADQITAMYHDVAGYVDRYNTNIAADAYQIRTDGVSFGQYTEIKHHAGNSVTDWYWVDPDTGNRAINDWNTSANTLGFQQFNA